MSEDERANDQEFSLLKDHNTVYKLIGPALVPQDQAEAKSNVEKRLEFIRGEMYVYPNHESYLIEY